MLYPQSSSPNVTSQGRSVVWCEKGPQSLLHIGKETKVQEQCLLYRHVLGFGHPSILLFLFCGARVSCTVGKLSVHNTPALAYLRSNCWIRLWLPFLLFPTSQDTLPVALSLGDRAEKVYTRSTRRLSRLSKVLATKTNGPESDPWNPEK